ncbi:MAG: UDP-N-acetyl-D-mannosamine dehydrogenase [Pelagibacteraceae bacterium TMED65]|nr:MAG: UDP-N-acetyl-D-mannosamine dehydrogenase [Pelagibacteraceae bacterium TMED65]
MKNEKKIAVVGLGYIGLPTAALLASKDYNVLGIDTNANAVDVINSGKAHIVEPQLDKYVSAAVSKKRFKASTVPGLADVYIICVPTPVEMGRKLPKPNINHVINAIKSISHLLKDGDLVILESTSPVGTTKKLENTLRLSGVNTDNIHIAYCPERVLPGNVIDELIENDRVVGGLTPEATSMVSSFYRTFVAGEIFETDAKTAELCKLTENSFRDVNLAFANELSIICEKEKIDVWMLIELANRHPRVNILQPGTGVGGHCIAVDPWFIVARDKSNSKLIQKAREVNDIKPHWVVDQTENKLKKVKFKDKKKPIVACLGLSFKPDIDDLRGSPAVLVVESLLSRGYAVFAVEPNIKTHASIELIDLQTAFNKADVFVILVKHKEFIVDNVVLELRSRSALDFCGALT